MVSNSAMKGFLVLLVVLVAVSSLVFAEGRISVFGKVEGGLYSTSITYSDLASSPAWGPADGEPVVSPVAALEIAQKTFKGQFPELAEFDVQAVSLEPLKNVDRWYYKVQFLEPRSSAKAKANGGGYTADRISYLVLMDKRCVKPVFVKKQRPE